MLSNSDTWKTKELQRHQQGYCGGCTAQSADSQQGYWGGRAAGAAVDAAAAAAAAAGAAFCRAHGARAQRRHGRGRWQGRRRAALGLPWSEMFRSASLRRPKQESFDATPVKPPARTKDTKPKPKPAPLGSGAIAGATATAGGIEGLSLELDAWLALYIAMAHAGLATALLVLYGLYLLLADFLRPLQRAFLCSVPLRGTQRALVAFWEPPLRAGLSAALLALPLAALRSYAATLADARAARSRARPPRSRASSAGSSPPSSSSSSSSEAGPAPRCSSSRSRSPSSPRPRSSSAPRRRASPAPAPRRGLVRHPVTARRCSPAAGRAAQCNACNVEQIRRRKHTCPGA